MPDVLPDLFGPGMNVVFCGTAVGSTSARVRAYYAGPGNQFWSILHLTGLTTTLLSPAEYPRLVEWGLGLTDVAKHVSGRDSALHDNDFQPYALRSKVERFRPNHLAFNGKKAAEMFFGWSVKYGRQPTTLGATTIWVMPSTSGAARGFWDAEHWHALARAAAESTTDPAPQ